MMEYVCCVIFYRICWITRIVLSEPRTIYCISVFVILYDTIIRVIISSLFSLTVQPSHTVLDGNVKCHCGSAL